MLDKLPDWLRPLASFIEEVVKNGAENELPLFAPAMAFSLVVSLAPLTIAVNTFTAQAVTAGSFLPEAPADTEALTVGDLIGGAWAWLGPFAAVAGFIFIIWGASGLFRQITLALARIWRQPGQKESLWTTIRKQLFAIVLLFAMIVALVASAVLGNTLAGMSQYLVEFGAEFGIDFGWIPLAINSRVVLDFIFATILFTVAYTIVPRIHPRLRDVLPGSLLTGAAYAAGQWGLGIYLSRSARLDALGTFGAFLGFLLWGYYTALIILWGAQITYVWARSRACARGGGDTEPYVCSGGSDEIEVSEPAPVSS